MEWDWRSRRAPVWIFQNQKKILKLVWKKPYSQDTSFTRLPLRDLSEAGRELASEGSIPGLNLVPLTLRINLHKTQCLLYSNRDHFGGLIMCQACAKWFLSFSHAHLWEVPPNSPFQRWPSLRENGIFPTATQLVRTKAFRPSSCSWPRWRCIFVPPWHTNDRFVEKIYIKNVSKNINQVNG